MSIKERLFPKSTISKYQGCLVGSAVGDALGAPAEFLSPEQIQKEYGVIREMVGGGLMKWREGQFTDDTEQTLIIVDSLLENQKYIPEDIANRLLLWFKDEPKDVGGTTATSLSILAQGHSWRESGKLAVLFGAGPTNGSLMRTAPIGLYLRRHPEKIEQAAAEISAITHADEDCILACQLASHLVALLASGYSKQRAISFLQKKYAPNSKAGIELRNALSGYVRPTRFGHVFDTLATALTSFLEAKTFDEAVVKAVNAGWDTDTQASVAGAFAGAFWGIKRIPERWRQRLNPVPSEVIEDKAQKLYWLNRILKKKLDYR